MTEHQVLISGAGPTGLMLAGELALAGVDVAVVERRVDQGLTGMRSGSLHARTLEVLDQRGVVDRFLADGEVTQAAGFSMNRLDLSDFPTRHPYVLALWQTHIERILAEWVGELGVPIRRGVEVVGFTQDDTGVSVGLADSGALRAGFLVGCDGGRSVVRKVAGIEFPGAAATTSSLIAQVAFALEPEWGIKRDAIGLHGLSKPEGDEPARVMVTEHQVGTSAAPSLAELSAALIAV